nr:MAG TPA: hypothetical protein [Caudoviricetes sp.]
MTSCSRCEVADSEYRTSAIVREIQSLPSL